ncbi:MAG: class I SAM-dependent methyltransferase [Planctomycetota bacterium]
MTSIHETDKGRFECNRSYEPYSDDPDYIAGNRGFIRDIDLETAELVLDLACGIGTLRNLLWESDPDLRIIGIDISHEGLRIARDRTRRCAVTANALQGGAVTSHRARNWLIAGSADAIPVKDLSIDGIVMGHAIHMLADVDKMLSEIHRVLRPGGTFAFSTSFYAGTFVPGTEKIYHDWVKEALNYTFRRDRELRAAGHSGIRRKRGSAPPAFSNTWPSPEDWTKRLERHGLRQMRRFIRTVPLTQYSFEAIGAYAGFAGVMLSGYPVEIACEALQAAAGPTLKAAGVDSVPRHWLEVAATKD